MGASKTNKSYLTILADEMQLVTISRRYLVSQKNAGALKTYLLNHKISEDFKPQGRAPDTESRKQMIQATISPEQCSVEDLINKHECGVINGRVLDVTWLAKHVGIDGEMYHQLEH